MTAQDTRAFEVAPHLLLLRRLLRNPLLYATWIYGLGLGVFLVGLEWYGERNWILSVCLYLPIQVWLVPELFFLPVSLIIERRMFVIHCGVVLAVLGVFGGYRIGRHAPGATERSLTVVTNNIGQSNHQSMQPFLAAEHPDLIALQDAPGRGTAYGREYPDRFVVDQGEFVLISKYPILHAGLVKEAPWNGGPVAARFELSFKGGPLVVYNVHMPTPRPDFFKLRSLGVLRELLGHNRRRSDGRSYAESMLARVDLAKNLAAVFRRETKPFIVVGDFNMPSHGCVYHVITGAVKDAFNEVGAGYGYSFPGVSSHLLMLWGPWLRLDYLFAGPGWTPVYCRVEPHRASQHRAVVARFEPSSLQKP